MSINIGAFVSTLLTPWLLHNYGAGWAFGIPGVLMALATLFFWLGRYKFVHIAPIGPQLFPELIKGENLRIIGRLGILYLFVAIFWSLFDQTGSSWVLQAKEMDRYLLGMEILPAQIQAANPLLIILLIPVFSYVIYPGLEKIFHLTSLRKIAIGFFLAALAFSVTSLAQEKIDAGQLPSIAWQLFSYLLLTSAEVMVSITALEYAYTQAPKLMKSVLMALFMLSISLGNVFTSAVNFFIQQQDGSVLLEGADYFWFFSILMFATGLVFALVSPFFKDKTILQSD